MHYSANAGFWRRSRCHVARTAHMHNQDGMKVQIDVSIEIDEFWHRLDPHSRNITQRS